MTRLINLAGGVVLLCIWLVWWCEVLVGCKILFGYTDDVSKLGVLSLCVCVCVSEWDIMSLSPSSQAISLIVVNGTV